MGGLMSVAELSDAVEKTFAKPLVKPTYRTETTEAFGYGALSALMGVSSFMALKDYLANLTVGRVYEILLSNVDNLGLNEEQVIHLYDFAFQASVNSYGEMFDSLKLGICCTVLSLELLVQAGRKIQDASTLKNH